MEGEDTIKVEKSTMEKSRDTVVGKLEEIKKSLDINTSATLAMSELLRSELCSSRELTSILVLLSASSINAQMSSSQGVREDIKSAVSLLEKLDEGLRTGVDYPEDDSKD